MLTQLKPSELERLLEQLIPTGGRVLITGKPGIGKTSIVDQACVAVKAALLKSFPAVEDPTEPGGYPWIAEDHSKAEKVLFGQAYKAVNAKKLTAWFLDDFGQAPASVQAGYMQWLLAGEMNGHKLPEYVTMIAATNRRVDRANVGGILEPVKSRFATIVELVEDLDDWCTWAFANDIPPEIVAFLRFRPELLAKFEPTADLTNSPLPRTWEWVGKKLWDLQPESLRTKAWAGAIGEAAAVEFNGFLRLYKDLPSIDGILMDPDNAKIPDQPATLYAVVTALGVRSNVQNFARVAKYIERLTGAQHGEFAALLVRDAARKEPEIQNTPDFNRLAAGELGQLVSGEIGD